MNDDLLSYGKEKVDLKIIRLYCNLDTSRATQGDYSFTYNYLSAESDSSPSVARRGVA